MDTKGFICGIVEIRFNMTQQDNMIQQDLV